MNLRAHWLFAIVCMIRVPAHAAFVFPVSHPLPSAIIFSVPPALGRASIQPALLPRAALSNQFRGQSARQTRSGEQQDFSALSFSIPAIMHLIKKIGVGGEECQQLGGTPTVGGGGPRGLLHGASDGGGAGDVGGLAAEADFFAGDPQRVSRAGAVPMG